MYSSSRKRGGIKVKNKTKKIIGVAWAILLIVLVQAIGITYAKYITSENAIGKAEVAKWAFEIVKDGEQMKKVNLADIVDNNKVVNGKIAPGTTGAMSIGVDATGAEVDMEFSIEFANEQNKPKNMTFMYMGKEYKSLSEIKMSGTIAHNEKSRINEIVVVWDWRYETGTTEEEKLANNIRDTQDANTIEEYTFDIIVTASQSK